MRKNILYLAALLPVFAACTSETVDAPKADTKAIAFDAPFIDKAVRADLTNDNITSFKVWGYVEGQTQATSKLFDGEEVTGNQPDATSWTYTNLKYWVDGANYSFLALAASPATAIPTPTWDSKAGDMTLANLTVSGDDDICYSYADRNSAADGTIDKTTRVPFTFKHLLSRVKFTLENKTAATDQITFTVSDVKFTGVKNVGTCTLNKTITDASTWAAAEGTKNINYAIATDQIAANGSLTTTDHHYVMPIAADGYEKYSVTAKVTIYQSGAEIKTVDVSADIAGFAFQQGYSYNFICQLNNKGGNLGLDNPILFTVTSVDEFIDYTETQWTTTDQITAQ